MEINANVNIRGGSSGAAIERKPNLERPKPVKSEVKSQEIKKANKEFNPQVEKQLREEDLIGVIEKANKEFIVYDRKFEFSIHEKTKQIMIKVIDATNDEVIRELPPERVLDMVAAMWEVAGIIVDRKI